LRFKGRVLECLVVLFLQTKLENLSRACGYEMEYVMVQGLRVGTNQYTSCYSQLRGEEVVEERRKKLIEKFLVDKKYHEPIAVEMEPDKKSDEVSDVCIYYTTYYDSRLEVAGFISSKH
jgi:hypothetical protein